jgi:hypothetical protein
MIRSRVTPALITLAAVTASAIGADTGVSQTDLARATLAEATTSSLTFQPEASASDDPSGVAWDAASLRIDGLIQTRYQANLTNGQVMGDDLTVGWTNPRIRLRTRWDPTDRISAMIQIDGGAGSTVMRLLDAEFEYEVNEHLSIRLGQGRIHYSREYAISITRQLGMDRTAVDRTLGIRRGEFINFRLRSDRTRGELFFSDGGFSANTRFNSPRAADFAVTARAEHLFLGDSFAPFRDFSAFRGTEESLMGGFAVHYADNDNALPDFFRATGDLSYENDGFNLFGSAYLRQDLTSDGTPSDLGFVFQGGRFITDQVELFGRYSVVIPDVDRTRDDPFHEFTIGSNHFIVPDSHAFKLTIEVIYYASDVTNGIVLPSGRIALVPSTSAQFAARAQLQLQF